MYRETRGLRPLSMCYGDIHRRVESLESHNKVSVLRRGKVNTLFDGKVNIREDGPARR